MELGGADRLLERLAAAEGAVEAIGAEQVLVVEDDVVDANDLVFAQRQVVEAGPRLVHVHAQGEVGVVIEVGPGADDPVDEAGLDQRHQARGAQPRRRQRPGQRQADHGVVGEHLGGEQAAGLAQAAGVVGQERLLDELRQAAGGGQGRRVDALVADPVQVAVAGVGGWQRRSPAGDNGSRRPKGGGQETSFYCWQSARRRV